MIDLGQQIFLHSAVARLSFACILLQARQEEQGFWHCRTCFHSELECLGETELMKVSCIGIGCLEVIAASEAAKRVHRI